jgi:hypothetical protein
MSQGNFRISSLVAKGRINRVLPVVSNSTIFVILTLPTFQCIRRSPHVFVASSVSCGKDAGFRSPAQWIISLARALVGRANPGAQQFVVSARNRQ